MPTTAKNRANAHPSTRFIATPFHNKPTEEMTLCLLPPAANHHISPLSLRDSCMRPYLRAASDPPSLAGLPKQTMHEPRHFKASHIPNPVRVGGPERLRRFKRDKEIPPSRAKERSPLKSCDGARKLCRLVAPPKPKWLLLMHGITGD